MSGISARSLTVLVLVAIGKWHLCIFEKEKVSLIREAENCPDKKTEGFSFFPC
jgi:hypothetical protein